MRFAPKWCLLYHASAADDFRSFSSWHSPHIENFIIIPACQYCCYQFIIYAFGPMPSFGIWIIRHSLVQTTSPIAISIVIWTWMNVIWRQFWIARTEPYSFKYHTRNCTQGMVRRKLCLEEIANALQISVPTWCLADPCMECMMACQSAIEWKYALTSWHCIPLSLLHFDEALIIASIAVLRPTAILYRSYSQHPNIFKIHTFYRSIRLLLLFIANGMAWHIRWWA